MRKIVFLLFLVLQFKGYSQNITLLQPVNAKDTQAVTLWIAWTHIGGTKYYDINYDTVANFSALNQINTLSGDYSITPNGQTINISNSFYYYGKTIYWRLRTNDGNGNYGSWSSPFYFKTKAYPRIISPLFAANGIDPSLSPSIEHIGGTQKYWYQLDNTPVFVTPIYNLITINDYYSTPNFTPISDFNYNMPSGTELYIRFKAMNIKDTSEWTPLHKFTTSSSNSIQEVSNIEAVFPNPATHEIYVYAKEQSTVRIYSMEGKEMYKGNLQEGFNLLELNEYSSGIYFISFQESNQAKALKFIVIKEDQ